MTARRQPRLPITYHPPCLLSTAGRNLPICSARIFGFWFLNTHRWLTTPELLLALVGGKVPQNRIISLMKGCAFFSPDGDTEGMWLEARLKEGEELPNQRPAGLNARRTVGDQLRLLPVAGRGAGYYRPTAILDTCAREMFSAYRWSY